MLRILVVALVVLVAAMFLLRKAHPPGAMTDTTTEVATVFDMPKPLPDVALTDTAGQPFSLASLKGHYALVFFGYTNCPDICPLTLAVLADAVRQIHDRAPEEVPAVVFVSVDPARDTPDRIKTYLKSFDPNFIGVTADDPTMAPLLGALSVMVHREAADDGGNYNVTHMGTIYVLDDAGRWKAIFGGSSHKADAIVHDYFAIRARAGG